MRLTPILIAGPMTGAMLLATVAGAAAFKGIIEVVSAGESTAAAPPAPGT